MEPSSKEFLRVERDMLGEIAIPAKSLHAARTERCIQNMSFSGRSLSHYPSFIRALAQVKKAAALANYKANIIDSTVKGAIAWACDQLIAGSHKDAFLVDVYAGGGSIAINSNINEVVANLANEFLGHPRGSYAAVEPKTHVNASQSTADSCHTAMFLALHEEWERLNQELSLLGSAARGKGQELAGIEVIARTCLQPALPAPLADFFGTFAVALERRRKDLGECTEVFKSVNLGGTVIGTGAGAPQSYRESVVLLLQEVTGLKLELTPHLPDAAQNIDGLAQVSSSLGILAGVLIKFAKDLRLMGAHPSAGFGELLLPAVQEGSSFFRGKVNPVIPETLIQCCFLVLGNDQTVRLTLEHGELNLNVFEGLAGICVLDSFRQLAAALILFREKCLEGIAANNERSSSYEDTLSRL